LELGNSSLVEEFLNLKRADYRHLFNSSQFHLNAADAANGTVGRGSEAAKRLNISNACSQNGLPKSTRKAARDGPPPNSGSPAPSRPTLEGLAHGPRTHR
jgi:hypothetical protein